MRVPIVTSRETYLMVSQGDLDLALPWHMVLRVVMTPRGEFDTNVRALGLPVLPPLVPLSSDAEAYPVVLIAHGLKRAYFVADRLIWRLPAEECAAALDPRAPGHARAVRAEDGEVYRVLDPARLLETVEPFAIPEPERHAPPEAESSAPPSPGADAPAGPGAPIDAETGTGAFASSGNAHAALQALEELPGQPEVGVIDEERVTPLPLRALVAEDSISARLVLVMLLEQFGFEVRATGSAAELFESLEAGPWALVCVDIELPDASGVDLLRDARESASGASVVALTRDGADELAAIEAGVIRSLGKPFSRAALARLLDILGFDLEGA
jgi:CheY-like chemotaxis protein